MNSDTRYSSSRRGFLQASGALGLAFATLPGLVAEAAGAATGSEGAVLGPGEKPGHGKPGHGFDRVDTAIVFVDPQNDVLSQKGTAWAAVAQSVTGNKTIEHMERIFQAAKHNGFEVFISPHYFYPTDSRWKFNGPLESDEFAHKTFARRGALTLEGFRSSGADWLERFKPYIEDGKTVVVSPHKVWGPQTNDLVLQLRKRRIQKVILGGMLANICVEAHLRHLLEEGFEIVVARDATAGPRHPEWGDGYTAALINFRFLAHAVLSTDEVVKAMSRAATSAQ